MREIQADIRESLWRDLKDRITEAEMEDQFLLNESHMSAVHIATGNTILSKGFKKSSGKQTAKLKSIAGATHVLIEESEEISEDDFHQLDDSLRTTKGNIQIIQLFNPPHKNHFILKKWYNLIDHHTDKTIPEGFFRAVPKPNPNLLSVFSTFEDNLENLHQSFIDNLRNYTGEYYHTIVKGLVSEGVRGRIYKGWVPIQQMPDLYTKFYGLDWGFNDPVSLIECEVHNKDLYIKQVVYEPGITNDTLNKLMKAANIPQGAPIYADSAEPKDIEDMKSMRWNMIAARKGPGSVLAGIRFIQKYTVHYVDSGTDLIMEYENYKWRANAEKLPTDEPEDKNNHLMDALRYAMDYITEGYAAAPTLTFHR